MNNTTNTYILLFAIGSSLIPIKSYGKIQSKYFDVQRLRAHKKFLIKKDFFKNSKGTLKRVSGVNSDSVPFNWMNLDPKANRIQGISKYKAEPLLSRANKKVIVAVIDSGVDVNHTDLDGKIWTNTKEIPNNNIDDDKNGYIDDIYGWNFIGHPDGQAYFETHRGIKNQYKLIEGPSELQVDADSLSITREYRRLKNKSRLSSAEKTLLKKLKEEVEFEYNYANRVYKRHLESHSNFLEAQTMLSNAGVKHFDLHTISRFISLDPKVMEAKEVLLTFLKKGIDLKYISAEKKHYERAVKYHFNINSDRREDEVGDNINDLNEIGYGNNNVIGPGADHGTHVAGIIAANNKNEIGIDGVAKNVLIMALRVVPDGDERDKDVAAAIYYAVNNGARIINMSFGKAYSAHKKHVQKAIQFAQINNVIITHAAGNENENNDSVSSFPSAFINGVRALNWLEVGASGPTKNNRLAADFSNFGKNTVDFFSPGVDIKSTIPGNDYEYMSGTSMAAPVTAGVLATILSEYPTLSTVELKAAVINNLNNVGRLYIVKPGLGNIPFSSLAIHDGTPNLFNALKSLLNTKTLLAFNIN